MPIKVLSKNVISALLKRVPSHPTGRTAKTDLLKRANRRDKALVRYTASVAAMNTERLNRGQQRELANALSNYLYQIRVAINAAMLKQNMKPVFNIDDYDMNVKASLENNSNFNRAKKRLSAFLKEFEIDETQLNGAISSIAKTISETLAAEGEDV